MAALRTLMKRAAETVLTRSGASRLARLRRRSDTLILAYHNVIPEGEPVAGELSLHLPQRQFAAQLDLLLQTHDIIDLDDVANDHGASNRPRAVITFDDACQGALTAGVAELTRRSLPATIFIAPGFVGGGSFWWDGVRTRTGAALSGAERDYALRDLAGRDPLVRAWALTQGMRVESVPTHQTGATEEQLRGAETEGMCFGAHSWSHPNLAVLEGADLTMELARPLEWLRARYRRVIPWLAYPYGCSSSATADAARAAGYEGGLRIEGGWLENLNGSADLLQLPRLNVPAGLSIRGFELRISGIRSG